METPNLDALTTLFGVTSFVIGAMVGSFLNVCVYRLPQGLSVVRPGSRCPKCEKETEREVHSCGRPTRLVRGWPWLTGDLVNLTASLVGALLALLLEATIFS